MIRDGKPRQISSAYSAPQFCDDWMDLARRLDELISGRIMCRGVKLNKHGAPMVSKSTGKEMMTWVPYER